MGWFDNPFGDKREKVSSIRAQQRKEQLQLNREIKEAERRERRAEFERKKLESQTKTARTEEKRYEAALARKRAKRAASPWPKLPTYSIKVKKKRQGRLLSKKRRITLF